MLGRLLRAAALALGVGGSTASGCAPEIPIDVPPQPMPPPPIATPAPPPSTPVAAAPAALDPSSIDVAHIPLVLDDPRLAAVKADADREAYAKAAQSLSAILTASPPAPEDKRAWLYQLGRLRALGGDPGGAAKAFEESASLGYVLADHARLQAAQWLVGIGQLDAAIASAKAVGPDPALAGPLDLVLADAHLGKRDFEQAAKRFRAYLARDKHPPQWVNVALRFANALLAHPSEAHAEEAVHLARRVQWESTGGQGAGEAAEIERKALDTLPSRTRKGLARLTADGELAKARGLMVTGQARQAVLATDKLVKLPRAKKASEYACDVWLVRAESLVKMKKKPEAAEAYKGAIEHCDGQPKRVDALFAGARASASAGRSLEAVDRFAAVEREFPKHRLADDARLRGARAALDAGDEARYTRMLERIADDYPEGDMPGDGLFELALRHIEQKAWAKAIPHLEKALARAPKERAYWASGRLAYYLARAHIELGEVERGKGELAQAIRDYPLSYYMSLAYARLAERDRGAAERALAESLAREPNDPPGAFPLPKGPWLEEPSFARALELLRQGDTKLARPVLDRLGLSARTAPREVQYTAAFMFSRAGDVKVSHGLFRASTITAKPLPTDITDWLDHYPAGRWRAAWEVAYPRPWASVVGAAARRQGVPEALAYAIMREESAFDPRVVSHAKAVGLMQLIVPTAKKMGESLGISPDEESLKDPSVNVPLGCHYLAVLRGQFPDNPLLAIPGYNAGGGAPKKWIAERGADDFDIWVERIPYEETRNYTKRVIGTMAAYEVLYTRDQPSEARAAPLAASPSARSAVAAQSP